jgi:toxin YoeB
MDVLWAPQASQDFDYWLATDAKIAGRIRQLVANIQETPFTGIGKPEPLRYDWAGYWSRRITGEHRLVYRVEGNPPVLLIAQCRYHY